MFFSVASGGIIDMFTRIGFARSGEDVLTARMGVALSLKVVSINERVHARDSFDRIADQSLDFPGRAGRALREAAHLGRHHRKSPALLAGTRG